MNVCEFRCIVFDSSMGSHQWVLVAMQEKSRLACVRHRFSLNMRLPLAVPWQLEVFRFAVAALHCIQERPMQRSGMENGKMIDAIANNVGMSAMTLAKHNITVSTTSAVRFVCALPLSLSHTHSHSHSLTDSLTHSHSLTLTHALSLSLSLSLSLTLSMRNTDNKHILSGEKHNELQLHLVF